jgi:xylose isomerase
MNDQYTPLPEHKFSFGLWTVSNQGRDPFGAAVRDPLPPVDAVAMLAQLGAWGVNLHDNDLVPIEATPAERDRIVREFRSACEKHGIVVPMATVNLFFDPVFRDGAFTSNDARVRDQTVRELFPFIREKVSKRVEAPLLRVQSLPAVELRRATHANGLVCNACRVRHGDF